VQYSGVTILYIASAVPFYRFCPHWFWRRHQFWIAAKMLPDRLKKTLRFYFITDDGAQDFPPLEQVRIAIQAGATIVQYRNKSFSLRSFDEAAAIRDLCKCNAVPFIVNDNILLAKAVEADGVHLGVDDEDPVLARNILGPQAIVGLSISNPFQLQQSDLSPCDYIGAGPVFDTQTKPDTKKTIGLMGLEAVVKASPLPVVAVGGIDHTSAEACFNRGAAGVAVISAVTRAENPRQHAVQISEVCGCSSRSALASPWDDEFVLIDKLIQQAPSDPYLKVAPGDDASLLQDLSKPVITTDTQKEGVHFRLDWQTPQEVGRKAVESTFSDLAASYAAPVSLFVNLALPPYVSDHTVEALYAGILKALGKHGCTLGGGNISTAGQLSLDLFAVGQGHDTIFPVRSGARPGYGLYCTGPLGLARAGLESLIRKDPEFENLIAKFKSPTARFDAAKVLADNNVTCVIDISDGLAGDARHIASASGLAIEFDFSFWDFDSALVSFCEKYRLKPEYMVLTGGEDYELLFACSPSIFEKIRKDLPGVYQVGRCLTFQGTHLLNLPPGIASYQHGKK
jgi:thiamin-phosphate kinase